MLFTLFFSLLQLAALIPGIYATLSTTSSAHLRRSHELDRRGSAVQIAAFLGAHNVERRLNNATDLSWSAAYADRAAQWADRCKFERTEGVLSDTPYGELHTAATGSFSIFSAVKEFIKDASQWNPKKPVYNHWTQVVWKSTTKVGCASARCNDLFGKNTGVATYYVCLYDPAGNIIGEATDNVQKLL